MANIPYDFYLDDFDEESFDPKDEILHESGEYLRDVLKVLYGSTPVDREYLEELLASLGKLLKVELPVGFLSIERRKNMPLRDFFSCFDAKSLYVTNKTI